MYKKIFYCVLLLIFFIVGVFIIRKYFNPFFTIVVLLALTLPIYNFLQRNKILNKKVNAVISIIIVNIIIFAALFYSGNILFIKFKDIFVNAFNNFTQQGIKNQFHIFQYFKLQTIYEKIKEYALNLFNASMVQRGASYTSDLLLSYFVGNICVYFILVDKYDIVNCIKKYISKEKIEIMKNKFKSIKSMILIEMFLIIFTTIQTIIGFMILGISSPVFLGILCGVLDILPYVGTVLIFLPIAIFNIYLKRYIISLGLILLYIFIQFSRQILEAKFMSQNLNIHPLLLLISIYVGCKLFGIIGVFIGPFYLIITKEIILS